MTSLGWISSGVTSFYARTRNSALLVAMLFLACAAAMLVPAARAEGLSDAKPEIRRAAARALAGSKGNRDVRAVKAALRREKDPVTRAVLAGVLGAQRPDESTLAELEQAALDPAAVVRLEAAAALGRVPGARATAVLAGLLAADSDAEVRQMAALRLAGRSGGLDALVSAAGGDADPGVRAQAVHALGGEGSAKARAAVAEAASDPHPDVKRVAKAAEAKP